MLCSDQTSSFMDKFLRLSFRRILIIACGCLLLCATNTSFAATKKHAALHKKTKHTVVVVTKTHVVKKQKTLAHTQSRHHRFAHKKQRPVSDEQKNVASVISISYEGATLVANVNKETPIKTATVNRKVLTELTTPKNYEAKNNEAGPLNRKALNELLTAKQRNTTNDEVPVSKPEIAAAEPQQETSLIQTITNAINLSPGKLVTPDEQPVIRAQAISEPVLKPIPAPAYLTKASQPMPTEATAPTPEAAPAPVVEHTSFAASAKRHLVNFVHKTVATLRYSDYKLGGKKFDTSRGVYIVDCSSFVDHILQRASPQAYLSLVSASGADTPATQHYYEFFTELSNADNSWNKVEAVDQLRAGDILVFRYKFQRL
jgi:hypothetical protein